MISNAEFRFGPFSFDPINGVLQHGSETTYLTPKDLAVLQILVANAGSLVTKSEIMKIAWPDTAVSDDVLTASVKRIRKILGDNYKAPQYIETIHRRGYRFICPLDNEAQTFISPTPLVPSPVQVVGRESELKLLEAHLDLAAGGKRQIVFVGGEAGIGKTTLVTAFRKQAAESCNMMTLQGQCIEYYGAGEAYRPILEAIGALCRSSDRHVVSVLKRYAPMWLLQIPGLVSGSEYDAMQKNLVGTTPDRMLRELAQALEVMSSKITTVMVIEDLHWSDAATLDAINLIARRQDPAHLMIVGTYRPEGLQSRDHPLRNIISELSLHANCREVHLPLLSIEELGNFLMHHFEGLRVPSALVKWLFRHTEGNPLFFNALLNHAKSQGWLKDDGKLVWEEPVEKASILNVPRTLRQMIDNNLNRLAPAERAVVEVGSVVGMTFPVRVLADSAEEEERLDALCHRLVRRNQLLHFAGHMTWPDGIETPCYIFVHSIYQQVVYDNISPVRQQQLHLQIGMRFEAAYREQIEKLAAALAMHFERGRDYQKAVRYAQRAGEIALNRNAYREVIKHMNRGLELVLRLPKKPERDQQEIALRIGLGTSLIATQGYASPQVENIYTRAHELCRKSEAIPQLLPVLYAMWTFYIIRADFRMAQEMGRHFFRIASQIKVKATFVWAHSIRSLTYWYQGQFSEAVRNAEKSVMLYDPNQQAGLISDYGGIDAGLTSWCHKAMSLVLLGYANQARQEANRAIAVAKDHSGPFMVAATFAFTSAIYLFRRELSATRQHLDEMVALSTQHGILYWLTLGKNMQGWAWAMEGRSEEGIAQIRENIDAYRTTGAVLMLNFFLFLLGDAYRTANETENGLNTVEEALDLTAITNARWIEAEIYRLKGDLLLQKAEGTALNLSALQGEAETCYQTALRIARAQQAKLFELRATVSLCRLLIQIGKHEKALFNLSEIYGWFKEDLDSIDRREAKALMKVLSSS